MGSTKIIFQDGARGSEELEHEQRRDQPIAKYYEMHWFWGVGVEGGGGGVVETVASLGRLKGQKAPTLGSKVMKGSLSGGARPSMIVSSAKVTAVSCSPPSSVFMPACHQKIVITVCIEHFLRTKAPLKVYKSQIVGCRQEYLHIRYVEQTLGLCTGLSSHCPCSWDDVSASRSLQGSSPRQDCLE